MLLAAALWPSPSDPETVAADVIARTIDRPVLIESAPPRCPRERVVLIAHRGTGDGTRQIDGRTFSENTLPAFLKAMEEGADGVEADYWTTSDGAVVTHHDDTVDRMTDGKGSIARLTRAELAVLRHSDGAAIPGFKELAVALRRHGGHRQQEIKEGARFSDRILRRMIRHDLRQVSYDRLLYVSSEMRTIRRITAIDPLVRVGLIHRPNRDRPTPASLPAWVDVILIHLRAADAGYVRRAREAGVEVSVRRVETVSQLRRAGALGVARVVTDRPELLGTAC